MVKKAWDATITDLNRYKISPHEVHARRQRMQSSNASAAREELADRRRRGGPALSAADMIGKDDGEDETTSALRQLEEVEAQLHKLAADSMAAPAPEFSIPPLMSAVPTLTSISAAGLELPADDLDGCETPPTAGARGGETAPWAAPRDAPEPADPIPRHERAGLAPRQPEREKLPAVDLEEEIEAYRVRSGRALAGAPPSGPVVRASMLLGDASPAADDAGTAAAAAHTRKLSEAQEAQKAQRDAFRAKERAEQREHARRAATAEPARAVLRTPATPPWRPASGLKSLKQPEGGGGGGGARAPDALGLARMQHACGQLTELVSTYEAEVEAAAPLEGGALPEGMPLEAATLKRPAAPAAHKGGAPPPVSFSACNAQLVELTSKLVGHLRRSDAELRAQAQLRLEAEASLEECRETLSQQADLAEAEIAALRREVRLTREDHASQLSSLSSQLASLQASRNTEYVRSMVSSLQQPTPTKPAKPIAPVKPQPSSAAAATPVGASPAATPVAPSLFSPIRPVAAPAPPAGVMAPSALASPPLHVAPTSAFESPRAAAAHGSGLGPSPLSASNLAASALSGTPAANSLPAAVESFEGVNNRPASPSYSVPDSVVESIASSLARPSALERQTQAAVSADVVGAVLGGSPFAWVERAATPRGPAAQPAAQPAVTRCTIRGHEGLEAPAEPPAFSEAAEPPTAPSELDAPFEAADGEDAPAVSNEVRSQSVLQAYYDELACRKPKPAPAQGKRVTSAGDTAGSVDRSRRMPRSTSAMQPTKLFVSTADLPKVA